MRKAHLRRVVSGRSQAFNTYLDQQTPERRRDILVGEHRYLHAAGSPDGARVATAVSYAQALRGPTYQFPVSDLLDRVR